VSAQAKPISEVVKDFEQSLAGLRPSTRRVYVAGAKAAIGAAGLELRQSYSSNELMVLIRESPTGKRISPFLGFLGGGRLKQPVSDEEIAALQNWVIQRLAKQMGSVKNPSLATRRDSGLIAALCSAPARGTPRKWPQNCLKITETEVLLWDAPIQEPCFALPLRFWHAWRERLARPDQRRLYRKSLQWSQSSLLFPGPWAGQPCTTLCGDWAWQESAAAAPASPSLRKRSESLSSSGDSLSGEPGAMHGLPKGSAPL